jgi:glycosyltransferase domain-containing protein
VYLNESNFSLLKKLTIIIPTYQRQAFALRCMQYWSGKSVTIIMLDGSKNSLDADSLSKLKSNIKYIHNPVSLYERMFSATSLIDTEYSILGSDDEFYIPSALNSCLICLSTNPELVSCTGRAFGFEWNGESVNAWDIYPEIKNLNLSNSNPTSRIDKHFTNYVCAHIYGVCRSSVWKVAIEATFAKEYSWFAAGEVQIEFLLVFAGKTKSIPEIMWMRSKESIPHRNDSPSHFPEHRLEIWWYEKKNEIEREDLISRMELACKEMNKLTNKHHVPNVRVLFETFIKYQRISIFFLTFARLPFIIRNMIKKFLKIFGYEFIKKRLLADYIQLLKSTGVKADLNELQKIEKIITTHYKKNQL